MFSHNLTLSLRRVSSQAKRGVTRGSTRSFSSINEEEFDNFNRYDKWWKDSPEMRPLHAYNKLRVEFMREYLIQDNDGVVTPDFFNNLKALDVGSGGGILSESLGRLGCQTLGIDPTPMSIKVAKEHLCNDLELVEKVKYKQTTIEELVEDEEHQNKYDFAASMEVIEHVNNQAEFVKNIAKAVKPNGLIFLSTLAKTTESWLLSIKLAEDLLGFVPRGTHNWDKYVNPEVLHEMVENAGFRVLKTQGAMYEPITNQMIYWPCTNVNYMMVGKKLY
ncbi:unnamed protein product [Moneuplotes crassus]|uniref:Ubiquinone biosynthesis O-methyltransferase, mitochondrial n=2 Tax=Euplotes crassus TaxID=5936 RepID=A0AAD2D3B3_EUPCR|nr:unnamed protein product [Moneuplotes crassus]